MSDTLGFEADGGLGVPGGGEGDGLGAPGGGGGGGLGAPDGGKGGCCPVPDGQAVPDAALGFDTLKVQAGYDPTEHNFATTVPLYLSAAFGLESPERAQRIFALEENHPTYSRTSNPTVDVFEQRMAALHGASAAVALSSGMAAVSQALLNAVGRGGRVITIPQLYGGTLEGFKHVYSTLGIEWDLVSDLDDPRCYEELISEDTKAIFVESLTNPFTQVLDIEALAELAHSYGLLLIVDNTVATPYLLNPLDFGADIVVYSATKGISGHGSVLAGCVVEGRAFDYSAQRFPHFHQPIWTLRDTRASSRNVLQAFPDAPFCGRLRSMLLNTLGATLSPFNAWVLLMGLDTLSERLAKQVFNTLAVLEYLEKCPHVSRLFYPTAADSKYRELAQKYLPRGAGSLLAFDFDGSAGQRQDFLKAVRVFSYQANIGDARSLIVDPVQTTHYELDCEQLLAAGLSANTIRLSIGLESPADLVADLQQAFAIAFGG